MTLISTQTGFIRREDSDKLLRAIFPNYPSLEPCHSAPGLETIPPDSKESLNAERPPLCESLLFA
jgi:hypothetical protein